jgi:ABC-2 type transport system ATP-binding protein
MSAVISARNLRKTYGRNVAVDSVSFDIPAGRIVGLIGPNGSGKTTTLKAALGLDIMFRKQFYQNLLEDYFDEDKTIVVTTHQVEEIEHILTDLMFIRDGRIVLSLTMDEVGERFTEVMVPAENAAAAKALNPIDERQVFGKSVLLFDGVPRAQLATMGETRNVGIADLFVAKMKGTYA